MAKSVGGWVLLKVEDSLRKLIRYALEDDGSLYLWFYRSGEVQASYRLNGLDGVPSEDAARVGKPRTKKLSYHATGRVHFDHKKEEKIFLEPLMRLTGRNAFAAYRIPGADHLDLHDADARDTDLVLPADSDSVRTFNICVCPPTEAVHPGEAQITFNGLFSLRLLETVGPDNLPAEVQGHFVTCQPSAGIYATPAVREDQAFVDFQQRINGWDGLLIFPPASKNDKGVYRVVPAVPMRTRPKLLVDFFDPSFELCEIDVEPRRENVDIRFRVRRKGSFLPDAVPIRRLTLDADIY
ncbi:hypothetical protein [Paraburkholderia lacunae]|uniref:Uncharacterized protein n=1 Tax=Paraburkholderia lacunae TaxID=2211104 RepID=A0A370N7Q8_9BURK|nr:hypothetical protein [Paraburkholderia lacunae]RDK01621.1 hypothetical protein DLM46_17625 [Paraburkholderia lacunae]